MILPTRYVVVKNVLFPKNTIVCANDDNTFYLFYANKCSHQSSDKHHIDSYIKEKILTCYLTYFWTRNYL